MTEPAAYDLLRSAVRSAVHLEMRDAYAPDDADWLAWQGGDRFDPSTRQGWRTWFQLMRAAVGRGVGARRARIVSEPVTDYIRYEYDVTAAYNLASGERVRWLPRQQTAGLLVPPSDFWVFDERVVVWNHFAGDGSWVGGRPSTAESGSEVRWPRLLPFCGAYRRRSATSVTRASPAKWVTLGAAPPPATCPRHLANPATPGT